MVWQRQRKLRLIPGLVLFCFLVNFVKGLEVEEVLLNEAEGLQPWLVEVRRYRLVRKALRVKLKCILLRPMRT